MARRYKNVSIENYRGTKTNVKEILESIIRNNCRYTVDRLKEVSPKGARYNNPEKRKDSYAEGWTYKLYKASDRAIVYNKKNYRLTHLLEHGHFIVNKKGGYGWSSGDNHIEKVFTELPDEATKIIKQADIDIDIY